MRRSWRWPGGPARRRSATAARRTWSGRSSRGCRTANVVVLQTRRETVWSKKKVTISTGRDPMASILATLTSPLHAHEPGSSASPQSDGDDMADRFPSPFEIATPPGAEGWEKLYRYSSLFG